MKLTWNGIRKSTSLILVILSLVFYEFFKNIYPIIANILNIKLKSNFFVNINPNIFMLNIMIVILINLFYWLISNKAYIGINYAIKHYNLKNKIEKQLIFLDYDLKGNMRVTKLPKIIINFENRDFLDCTIKIQNIVKYDKNIEKIRLNASLGNYFVISEQKLSIDGNWYIFKCKHIDTLKQIVFNKKVDYIKWCDCDNYSYRISKSDVINISHCAISGQTGSGKTYFLQSIILQLLNKTIPAEFTIIDPKHADLYYFSFKKIGKNNVTDKANAINYIKKFYNDMSERQNKLLNFFENNPNSDYRKAKLPAKILIIDEFGSLRNSFKNLSKNERDNIDLMLTDIAFIGRQLGCFLWIATQQFNYQIIPTQLTEQMNTKIVLGNSDEQTYRNLFSSSVSIPNINLKPGYGYISYPNIATVQNPMLFVSPYCKFLSDSSA